MSVQIKDEIKAYYGGIAKSVTEASKASCGCSASCCGDGSNESFLYSAEFLKGVPIEAVNASLGCANPLVLANLQKGETVLDLGSGGGIDVLIASKYVGEMGRVIGLDMTDEMLELAHANKVKSGVENVRFVKGFIEDIPLESESVDVVTSNCVINLSEDKEQALKEAYRVLRKGGRFAIADIVQLKDVSEDIMQNVQLWVGCISGALKTETYKALLEKVGFNSVEITPVNVYTKDIIRQIAEDKNLGELYRQMDEDLLDGAFAGAHVKAIK